MSLHLASPAFGDGGPIPRAHTCDGADQSPPLLWKGMPTETAELALVLHDPDAPRGEFAHWVLYDLDPGVTRLPPGLPRDGTLLSPIRAHQGTNDYHRGGYGGPCPPPGPPHRYVFTLYALSEPCGVPVGATRPVLLHALRGKVIESARLTGTYGRG